MVLTVLISIRRAACRYDIPIGVDPAITGEPSEEQPGSVGAQ